MTRPPSSIDNFSSTFASYCTNKPSYDPTRSLTRTPRSRPNFAPVSRAAERPPSWKRMSTRYPGPAGRRSGVACRVSGYRESLTCRSPSELNTVVGPGYHSRSYKPQIQGIATRTRKDMRGKGGPTEVLRVSESSGHRAGRFWSHTQWFKGAR